MDIWHVENKTWTKLRLWRMDTGDFRVTEAGTYEPFLTNATYTLVDKRYSSVFEQLNNQVIITPVKIHDYLTKTANDGYIELKVLNQISLETIERLENSGRKAWVYNGELFVTSELKNELLQVSEQAITFSQGFSKFGA
jgi:hypothetical protein